MTGSTLSVLAGTVSGMGGGADLQVKRDVVQLDGDDDTRAKTLDLLRRGTFPGTVAGHQVIGIIGIADLIGVRAGSLHTARSRRLRSGRPRRPRDLPDPLYQVEHHGAIVHLFDLVAVRTWAMQTGRLPLPSA